MHVKAKQVAILGMLAAVVTIAIIMASVIETNTLFLLAAASFAIGIAIREFGMGSGIGFWLACLFLGVLLSPNKIYILTFGMLSLYIIADEASYILIMKSRKKPSKFIHGMVKLLCFNLIYVPLIIFFPKLIYAGKISIVVIIAGLFAGQIAWFIYDRAYEYVQETLWNKAKKRFKLDEDFRRKN